MMKRFIIIAAVIILLVSCHHTADDDHVVPVNPPQQTTFIVFDNTQGICTVTVYDDYLRRDEDKIAEIPSGKNSDKIAWTPGESVPFYFSYRITIKGINDFSLNYVPEIGKDQKTVRIDKELTTTIKVPTLSETISSPDQLLSNNSYLIIQNNSSYSFELHQGTSKIKPDNISSSLVNSNERAQYTINSGSASNYRLLIGADYKEFSGSIVNFEAGHIYKFDFNGSISIVSNTELKLENVDGITVPQQPEAPVVLTSNGALALRWSAVESATAYEIWISTVNDSASASKYGTDITGSLSAVINNLINGTVYYIWLKAKNNMGTSGFSPVSNGTPYPHTEKPSDPQSAPTIIAGNGQFNVRWQAVERADIYEIWVGTVNNAQTATKWGEDVSGFSAMISGLNNGTIYYVWIKAKNNIDVGGFSPSANGIPLGTPGKPTVTSGYNSLLVTWTAVAGASEYEVYYGTGTPPTTLAVTTAGTTATIIGLTNDTVYYVRLRAKNVSGVSVYGESTSGVPGSGLFQGTTKIGNLNLANSLIYISSNAVSGDDFYIFLGANESISPKELNYSGKNVNVTLLGCGDERIITLNANGSMFTVNSGVTLILDKNITLVGRSANTSPLVSVSNGSLIMNDGVKITGNICNSHGGGVYVKSGTFNMNGGTISENNAYGGGGVYVETGGIFVMHNGTIKNNTTNSVGGGGICIFGTSNIYGGIITKNEDKSSYGGGGIFVFTGGVLTMYDGTISGNTANRFGGGVYVYTDNSTFTMYGGVISGNTAKESGGGIDTIATFKKLPLSREYNSGIVYGSEAVGVDAEGIPLKNTSNNNRGHAVAVVNDSSRYRNTTAGETDQIDTTTGKGLSTNGNPPYGQ